MKFFKKELFSNKISLPNGKHVVFEQLGESDTGVIATNDAYLGTELDKAAAAERGGLISITEEQYNELKKNPPGRPSHIRFLNAQTLRKIASQKRAVDPEVAATKQESSAPMEVPKGLVTKSSMRKLKEMTEGLKSATAPPRPAVA